MKNKDLLRLIKTKSEEIKLKDFSAAIVEKARLLPQLETIEQPKRHFQLKPSLAYSFTLLTAVVAFFVLYNPASPIIPQIEDMNQVVALSSVTAVSLIDFNDTLIDSTDNVVSLSLGYITLDTPAIPQIDQEIDDVSMYLSAMEKLLNSNDNFGYQLDTTSSNGYANHLNFTTRDLLDQEIEYRLNFNQSDNSKDNQFTMQGNIEIGDVTYAMTAVGELNNPQNIQLRFQKDASNYIDVSYNVSETMNRYQISTVENGNQIQTVNLFMKQVNNQKSVYLDFIEGQSTGSYAFKVKEVNQMKQMNISYYISGSTSESGEIDVVIDNSGATAQYGLTIKPKGQIPYIIERGRGSNGNSSGPGNGNPGGSNH